MNNLQTQIDNLKTLQESYDAVAQAAEAYNTGKVQLAQNITAKGVSASASETLPELAEKVSAISQQPIILSPSEVGDMYAVQQFGSLTTPNYWNLYEVLNTLLNDGRLLNYGGILLAEYYKGYDSLALSGAGAGGAYVVSDMENGVFKMYTEDVTHVWATGFDGKLDRWVAYCFANSEHDFDIVDENTSPRIIHIGRNVGYINLLSNARISQIVLSENGMFKGINQSTYSCQWDKKIVLKTNTRITDASSFLLSTNNAETIYMEFPDEVTITTIGKRLINIGDSLSCACIVSESIKGWFNGGSGYGGIIGSNNVVIAYAKTIENCIFSNGKRIYLPVTDTLVISDNRSRFIAYNDGHSHRQTLEYVYIGYTNPTLGSIGIYDSGRGDIIVIELKEGFCKNFTTNYALKDENSIYTYILQRLKQDEPDCGDGVTITLGSTNLAKLTSEESVQLLDDLTNIYGYTFA